jgi:hypothetical protein
MDNCRILFNRWARFEPNDGLCLLNAVYDQISWLLERGSEYAWPEAAFLLFPHCGNKPGFLPQ